MSLARRSDTARKPTDREYLAYDGMHCSFLWRNLPEDWQCPCCLRTKRGILQWGKRKGSNAERYGPVGWKAGVHRHHDHSGHRFKETVICGGCNTADAQAKKIVGAPKNFSFSPAELRQFISATDNGPVKIAVDVAITIYGRIK